jgi:hypothetical protein
MAAGCWGSALIAVVLLLGELATAEHEQKYLFHQPGLTASTKLHNPFTALLAYRKKRHEESSKKPKDKEKSMDEVLEDLVIKKNDKVCIIKGTYKGCVCRIKGHVCAVCCRCLPRCCRLYAAAVVVSAPPLLFLGLRVIAPILVMVSYLRLTPCKLLRGSQVQRPCRNRGVAGEISEERRQRKAQNDG